jgi:sporulation protein YlmC with PRC-barrel domain
MLTRISAIALTIILAASPLLMADTLPDAAQYTESGAQKPNNALKVGDEPKRMSRYMNDREVFNENGKQIGTVSDIVLDASASTVGYLVLSLSGSDKLFAVPWAAFQRKTDQSEKLYLILADDTLKNAPGFPKDQWPDMASDKFQTQIDSYYQTHPIANKASEMDKKPEDNAANPAALPAKSGPISKGLVWSRRASAVIESKVVNTKDQELGVIKELVFNPRTGVVHYAVLSYGGFLGQGNKLFAVPIRSLNSKANEKTFVLDLPADYVAKAPSFDKDKWPSWNDEPTRTQLDDYYTKPDPNPAPSPVK